MKIVEDRAPFRGTKKGRRILLILIVFSGTWVQSWSQQQDTIVPVDENKQRSILEKLDIRERSPQLFNFWQDKFTGHWAGIDFGLNGFFHSDYTGYGAHFLENDLIRSNSASLNLAQFNIGLQRNRNTIGLVTGAGLHLQSYRLNKNTTLRETENGSIEAETLYFDQNQKSKFSIVSAMVPLLAEFQIPVNHYDNRIYLSAGIYTKIRISSHTKIKYRTEGKKEKRKIPGPYALHDIRYGTMIRAGYRRVNLYATFGLVPLFRENKGPRLLPFSFGITLLQF